METVNVPGSAQPAAARCAACLRHHRTPSFVPTILWQGCIPREPIPPPCLPPSQHRGQGLCCLLPSQPLPSPDGGGRQAGRGFQAPQPGG